MDLGTQNTPLLLSPPKSPPKTKKKWSIQVMMGVLLILIAVPVGIFLVSNQQIILDLRSRAGVDTGIPGSGLPPPTKPPLKNPVDKGDKDPVKPAQTTTTKPNVLTTANPSDHNYTSEGFMGANDTRNVQMSDPSTGVVVNSYYGATKDGTVNFSGQIKDPNNPDGTISYIVRPGATNLTPGATIGIVTTSGSSGNTKTTFDIGGQIITCITTNGKFDTATGCHAGETPITNLTNELFKAVTACANGVCSSNDGDFCIGWRPGQKEMGSGIIVHEPGRCGVRTECLVPAVGHTVNDSGYRQWTLLKEDACGYTPGTTRGENPGGGSNTTVSQCSNISILKQGTAVSPSTLKPNDAVIIAISGGNATKAHVRINGGAWLETTTKQGNAYVIDYVIPTGVLNFVIESEIFGTDGKWH